MKESAQDWIRKQEAEQFRVYREAIARISWETKVHKPLPGEVLAGPPQRVRRPIRKAA